MRLILTIALLLVAAGALADTEMRFEDGSQVLVKDGRVAFGDADTVIIYPGSGTTMTVVEHGNRQYMIIDEEFAGGMASQMQAAMAQMQEQLASLPPEQRAMMQEMLKQRMPAAQKEEAVREFRRSGKRQKVAGISCAAGELIKDGEKEFELCISSPDELGMPNRDYKALRSAFAAMSELVGKFAPGNDKVFDLEVIGGIPIVSRSADGNQDSRLASASFESIDAARLEVPAGYQQKDPSAGM